MTPKTYVGTCINTYWVHAANEDDARAIAWAMDNNEEHQAELGSGKIIDTDTAILALDWTPKTPANTLKKVVKSARHSLGK